MVQKLFYLLWDESHLWGLMLRRALEDMEIPFKLIGTSHIAENILEKSPPAGLLIPGGWAKLKADNLGEDGLSRIREYIHSGGKYLGVCGGAGLGLQSPPKSSCLDLCSWTRKAMHQRLPNFSGHVRCQVSLPQWSSSRFDIYLPAWWPSQFQSAADPGDKVQVVASYLEPGDDFWTADLRFKDLKNTDIQKWEELYGINLDPELLEGEPCIIRGSLGKGEYILSYVHLETPESSQANALLRELLHSWLGSSLHLEEDIRVREWNLASHPVVWEDKVLYRTRQGLEDVIRLGREHFLLFWRLPWLLGWRRGIPGSQINFLYAMLCQVLSLGPDNRILTYWYKEKQEFERNARIFLERVKNYLIRERLALSQAPSSPESSSDLNLQKERKELFGSFPGYGGFYARLLRPLDEMLFMHASPENSCKTPDARK